MTGRAAPADIVWRRHPADLARLVAATLVLLALLGLAELLPDALTSFSDALVELFADLPTGAQEVVGGVAQVAALLLPLAALGYGITRRAWRLLLVVAASSAAAAAVMAAITDWLDRVAPPNVDANAELDSWLTGRAFPSSAYLAGLAAALGVLAPLMPERWRRAAWGVVGVGAVLRLVTVATPPVSIAVAVTLGIAVGAAVLLALGAPARRLTPAVVTDALAALGLPVGEVVELAGTDRRSFRAVGPGGEALFLTYVGRDERDADLLYRVARLLRVKGIDDELAGVRPGSQVRHEALTTFLAREAGVRVPAVHAVGETSGDEGVLAVDLLDGSTLAAVDPATVDDGLLADLWTQVRALHGRRIAHRRLAADQVQVLPDGTPALLGLRWAQPGADDVQLAADVAELLVATAVLVGPARAVAAARAALGDDALAGALPLVQPLALSTTTRKAAKADKGLLDEVRTAVQDTAHVDAVELFPLERLGIAQVVTWFGFLFLITVGLAFISNWSAISDALRGANWDYLPVIVVLGLLPFPAGALSLMGSVLRRLPFGMTTVVMFAQSFLNRFTPMNAGGMAMRVRYLQKGGTDVAVAAAAVGLTSAASGVMQGVMILTFALWSGQSASGAISLPDVNVVALVILAIALVAAALLLFPRLRRFVVRWFKLAWDRLAGDFGGLLDRPGKLGLLFGGAGLSKLFTITAFVVSCRALGISLSYADLGMLYLIGSSVGAAVPTPGGIGGIEAALIAVLTGAGVDTATAAAATTLFRLVTFWLPVLPGYGCLRYSRRAELI